MELDFSKIVGLSTPWRKIEYNWRDMALYALAVGAGKEDLLYTYEKGMKAIPSFGCLPYYNAVNNEPQQPKPYAANYLAADIMAKLAKRPIANALHAGFQMEMYGEIPPVKGSLVHKSEVVRIYDRGSLERGIMMEVENPVYDESGQLICMNTSYHLFQGVDGSGLPEAVKKGVEFPDRTADYEVQSYVSSTQNVLYRLTGDTNYVHIDPEQAHLFADRPFMQGLSSFGFACRMAVQAVIPGEPERMKRMYVQMRSIAYPGIPVKLLGWKTSEKKMVFRYIDCETGKSILDHCEFEWD